MYKGGEKRKFKVMVIAENMGPGLRVSYLLNTESRGLSALELSILRKSYTLYVTSL